MADLPLYEDEWRAFAGVYSSREIQPGIQVYIPLVIDLLIRSPYQVPALKGALEAFLTWESMGYEKVRVIIKE